MATKRLATDDGLNRIVEAIKNQDTVKARNAEIDAHAKEVMDSLPSDYTDLVKRVDNIDRSISTLFAMQRTGKVYGVKAYKYPVYPT